MKPKKKKGLKGPELDWPWAEVVGSERKRLESQKFEKNNGKGLRLSKIGLKMPKIGQNSVERS